MKRIIALLLALGILLVAAPIRAEKEDKDKDEKKDKDVKKEDKKEEKKDKDVKKEDKKEEKDKDKGKVEEKLTDEQKKELEKLAGTFTVIEFEREGKKAPADELKKMKVKQEATGEWTFTVETGKEDKDITKGKDTPHPDKKPKQIESVYNTGKDAGKKVLGIYEINNDTIKYCWAATDAKERPKEFAAKDPGVTLMVLKRVKEEKPDEKDKDKKDKDKDKDKDKKDKDKDEKDKDKKDKDEKDKEKKDKDKA